MTPEERGQPVRLDRERILDAAAEIVGNEGLPALTMRRIGAELGADPTAVYRHFRNKQEMLTELANRLFATEAELDPDAPWQDRLRAHVWHALLPLPQPPGSRPAPRRPERRSAQPRPRP